MARFGIMNNHPTPDLSVVLVAHRDSESLRWALQRMCNQSVSSRIECVLVTRSRMGLAGISEALDGHLCSQIVEDGHLKTAGAAKAAV